MTTMSSGNCMRCRFCSWAGKENLLCCSRQLVFSSVQGVMKGLGHFEEIVPSSNHIPVGDDSEFSQQWNQAIQHFCHSSTNGGGVDHLHSLPLCFAGEKAQFGEFGCTNNRLVVVQVRRRYRCWRSLPGLRLRGPFWTEGYGVERKVTTLRASVLWKYRTAIFGFADARVYCSFTQINAGYANARSTTRTICPRTSSSVAV